MDNRKLLVINKNTAVGTTLGFLIFSGVGIFYLGKRVSEVQDTLSKVPTLSTDLSNCSKKVDDLSSKIDGWHSKDYWTVSEMREYNNQMRINNPSFNAPNVNTIKDQ